MPGASDFLKGGGSSSGGSSTSGGGGGAAAFLKTSSTKSSGGSSKKGGGFFGINLPKLPLIHVDLPKIGVHTDKDSPLTQVGNLVKGAGPSLFRLGGDLAKELAPRNPFAAKALAPQDRGWHNVQKQMPLTSALVESPVRTVRQVPDLAVGLAVNKGSLGQRAANTNLGRQVHEEGVLGTGLAKVADLSMLAGGVGVAGKAAGVGRLAKAAELEKLAGLTSEAAKLGKVADAEKLTAEATKAAAAGDVTKAVDLSKAAQQVQEAQRLRGGVATAGRATRAAETVTEKAGTLSHFGNRAAAAPFIPTEKALGLATRGLGAAGRAVTASERFAPIIARVGEKAAPIVARIEDAADRLQKRRAVGDLYHNEVRSKYESEMHNLFDRQGLRDLATSLNKDEQAAIYLSKAGQSAVPGLSELLDAVNELPSEVRPDALRQVFPDVTPEQVELARRFDAGDLEPAHQAKLQSAADRLTNIQKSREERNYVTGRGTSRQLSDEALANREARARGESAPADVEAAKERRTATPEQKRAGQNPRKVSTLQGRLEQTRAELDDLNTAPSPEPVPNSRAQERRLAAHAERVRRDALTLKGEESRSDRLSGTVLREQERNTAREANRTGQVIGRSKGRLEEADQLETGLGRRQRQGELKARRLAKDATVAEKKAAEKPAPKIDPRRSAVGKEALALLKEKYPDVDPLSAEGQRLLGRAIENRMQETPKYSDLTPKGKADSTAAAKRAAADEARAEANKLKGVSPAPTRSRVLSDVNLDAQRANVASRAEQGTANRLLGGEAKRQGEAVERAQKKLASSQSAERAAKDRFERENQGRADKAQQKRFDQLQERERKTLDQIAQAEEEARNSIEAAPPQDRPALQTAYRAKKLALDLSEAFPEHADKFKGLADDIAATSSELRARGVEPEFFLGGKAEEKTVTPSPTATLRSKRKLQSERNRVSGTLDRTLTGQSDKMARETLDILHNEFHGKLQDQFGSTAGKQLDVPRFATGDDIAAAMGDENLVAWDPKTGKQVTDPKLMDRNTAVIDKDLFEYMTKYTRTKAPGGVIGGLLKVYDKATGGWKHSVLALSPRWHVGNIVGNAALATLGAGLSPAQIVAHIGEARRLVKAFDSGGDIPPQYETALRRLIAEHNPDLATIENARALGKVINKSYRFNETVDSINRVTVYLAKKESGISSEAAVQMALKAAGDFSKMTPFEKGVIRRIIPFYAWQRHITRLAFSLPIEAPARVAWTLHLAEMENQIHPDPGAGNPFNEGTIPFGKKRINVNSFFPFSSSFFTDPTFRGGGYQFNPILKDVVAGATGFNLGKMKQVSGTFRGKNPSGFGASPEVMAAKHPNAFAAFLAQQFPQVPAVEDMVTGKVPVRYDTGEPRHVGPGATKKNAKPTLTGRGRLNTAARLAGLPVAEPEQKQTTKKK